jgi:zinc transport system ATP-binding protein
MKTDQNNILLSVKNLNISLNNEEIIKNLSFEIKEGETLAILGPNGGGKTTLLKALVGLIPYSGEINWQKNISYGYIPQRLPYLKDIPITVYEFFKLRSFDKPYNEILNSVGLNEDILNKKISYLSLGQFERILIAWTIFQNPKVLLFDEPFSGIDIGGQESVYSLLHKFKHEKNLTIIFITHEMHLVSKLAQKVLCLNKKMLCYSEPQDLTPEFLSKIYLEKVNLYIHKHDESNNF